jgi:hypothetical protein
MPAFSAASFQNQAAIFCLHAGQKAMRLRSATVIGLECALHFKVLSAFPDGKGESVIV